MSQTFRLPTVYVINLDSRPDRWETIRKLCHSCGIYPQRVSGIKAAPGWHGCGRSHAKVAELAQSRGEPWYIVLEDDATFTLDDWRRFTQLLPLLWSMRESWNIFNGGPGEMLDFELISHNPILFKIRATLSHCILVNSSLYSTIIGWSPEKYHFDQYVKNNSKMISTYPFISKQLVGQSDIGIGNPNEDYYRTEASVRTQLAAHKLV